MTPDKDYVLGTHDEEIERLGLQHRVWRSKAADAWQRAGFSVGQTLLDVGCGPGYAAVDLAEIVGARGRVYAIDRSRRFLDHLVEEQRRRKIENVETIEMDLDDERLGAVLPENADGAWFRWVLGFVTNPRKLLGRIGDALRPGGRLVIHEYFDYSTWRLAPRAPALESFVENVIAAWRNTGGDPDVGLALPAWLNELGFDVLSTRPLIEIVGPSDYRWQWPQVFVDVGVERMLELGAITPQQARETRDAVAAASRNPHALMITPAVIEIIATRAGG